VKGRAPTRLQLAATLTFAVLLTGGLAGGTALVRAATACQQVLIATSQEKSAMLQGFATAFNGARPNVDGRCVRVRVEEVNSGDAELALAKGWTGKTRPDVWSPASTAWVDLLSAQEPAVAAQLLPVTSDFLFESPLVIGMPEDMAQALRYPARAVDWARVLQLAQDPRGWGAYGHPEWGPFKLGKTNPTISTSGLHALIAAYYAAPGGSDLTPATVGSGAVEGFVGKIESSVVHYGQTASAFLHNLRQVEDDHGRLAALQYISAIAVEEQELADYNSGLVAGVQYSSPIVKLVAIYPAGGTLVANHPYVVLGWSTALQKTAAREFEDYIRAQTETIESRHFRLEEQASPSLKALVSPTGNVPVLTALAPPPPAVLKAMILGWKTVRKAARVLILIDTAAAPRELNPAISSLAGAVSGFLPQDKVGIWTFPAAGGTPASHTVLRDLTPESGSLGSILSGVRPTTGRSDLDGALRAAVIAMASAYDPNAIDAVLVLELSPPSVDPASDIIRFLGAQTPVVRVFTIGPFSPFLEDIAGASLGTAYEPGSASHFLNDAISNF
jgi:Ca-activated chloride channel family protein